MKNKALLSPFLIFKGLLEHLQTSFRQFSIGQNCGARIERDFKFISI